jgi:hypothetical protein
MTKPKNWYTLSEEDREAWWVKQRESHRKYHEANRGKILERQRKYRKANPEKGLKYAQKYKDANPDKVAESKRKYRTKTRTQADADRFFQLMNAANEIKKAISEINQSNEI